MSGDPASSSPRPNLTPHCAGPGCLGRGQCRHERPSSTFLHHAPCRAPWGWLPVASSAPPFQSLRIFSGGGGSGEAKGLWPPNLAGASTAIKRVHPPSSPPDLLRLSPLHPSDCFSPWPVRRPAFSRPMSVPFPPRRPRQLRSELVPSAAFSCGCRRSTPPLVPGRYGFRTHFPSCSQGQAAGPHLCAERGRATGPRFGPAWRGRELAWGRVARGRV